LDSPGAFFVVPIFRPGALNRQPRGASAIADGARPRSLCDFPHIAAVAGRS
jgi:hypothetical protein